MAKLTTKAVEAIKPATVRREIPDQLLRGLYLIVQPSGVKSWAVRYRHNSKSCKHTLGSYPALDLKAARELGAKALRAAAEGRDPTQEKKQQQAASVEAVVALFIEKHCQRNHRPKTLYDTTRLLRLYVLPAWSGRAIGSINRGEVRDLLDKVLTDSSSTAIRVFILVRKLFNWCIEQDILAASPVAGLKKPAEEGSRDRVLDDNELKLIWHAAEKIGYPYAEVVKLLVLTGQRRSEIAAMTWQELDLKNRLLRLPRERVKNDRSHDVPLSPQALAVIEQVPHIGERFVFTISGNMAMTDFGNYKKRLDALLPPDMPPWVLHDIRRSCASGLARLGISLPVIERVLNHVSGSFGGIVGVYQHHQFSDEKRAALERWGNHIERLISGVDAVVVPLRAS